MTNRIAVLLLINIALVCFGACNILGRKAVASIDEGEFKKLTDESERIHYRLWPGKKVLPQKAHWYAAWRNYTFFGGL